MNDNYIYKFSEQLQVAEVISRPNRFVAFCKLNGEIVKAHCPVTGSIGGFDIAGMHCLLSSATAGKNAKPRATTHTLEAISPWDFCDEDFQWIGVNQNQVNRYVENALLSRALNSIPPVGELFEQFDSQNITLKREPKIGSSKLDFLVGEHLAIEVKTPLRNLLLDLPDKVVESSSNLATNGTERMLRQMCDVKDWMLGGAGSSPVEILQSSRRALLISAFLYDGKKFTLPNEYNEIYSKTVELVNELTELGLYRYQVNFQLDEFGVKLIRSFSL